MSNLYQKGLGFYSFVCVWDVSVCARCAPQFDVLVIEGPDSENQIVSSINMSSELSTAPSESIHIH